MKKTDPGLKVVRIPARSLGFSRAGALVGLKSTPISEATTRASVVLPRPGGPHEKEVIEGFGPSFRRLYENRQVFLDARLSLEL